MEVSKQTESILLVMWTVALGALLGSLFYSELIGYEPCKLCWIQRIFMYPLVMIYGVALVKRNFEMALPGVFLSGIGMLIAIYHYLLQKLPALQNTGDFCGDVPCNFQYVNYLGFITIPFLSAIAFMVIFGLHMWLFREVRR